MNKFKKIKHSRFTYNEDSSDYISDVETSHPKNRMDIDSFYEGNSNSHLGAALGDDYSNDSFNTDRDNEYAGGYSANVTGGKSSKSGQNGSKLTEGLDYLHRMLIRKDKEGIFEFPVTDQIAPGYSQIIKNPMDLSTMKSKIDNNEYSNIMEYRDDLILMCENCMTYNNVDTIYYSFAKKMLDYGFKLLSREKLLNLRSTVRCMRYLSAEDLGFSLEATDIYYDTNAIRKKQSENKLAVFNIDISNINTGPKVKESWLIPPEGEDETEYDQKDNSILEKVRELAQVAADRLEKKNPHGKMGFLRRNSNGTTGYHIIECDNKSLVDTSSSDLEHDQEDIGERECKEKIKNEVKEEFDEKMSRSNMEPLNTKVYHVKIDPENQNENKKGKDSAPTKNIEKAVTIGNLMEGLQTTSYSMSNYMEEKKDKTNPMCFVEKGPFSSHAPTEDSSFKNLPKEDLNILASAYGDEVGYQYALSLMEFCKSTGEDFKKHVKTTLNELSCNEHEKYLKYVNSKSNTQQGQALVSHSESPGASINSTPNTPAMATPTPIPTPTITPSNSNETENKST